MSTKNMPRCGSCAHWYRDDPDVPAHMSNRTPWGIHTPGQRLGECAVANDRWAAAISMMEGVDGELITDEAFGCVRHVAAMTCCLMPTQECPPKCKNAQRGGAGHCELARSGGTEATP